METRISKPEVNEIDLFSFFKYLWQHAKWIICAVLLGAFIAGIYAFIIATPQYEATAQLYVLSSKESMLNLSDLQIGSYLTSDYQLVFDTREVSSAVIDKLDLSYTVDELQSMLKVTNPTNTRILFVTVTSSNAAETALLANTYADVARQYISDVMQTDAPTILSEAYRPEKPVRPQKKMIFGLCMAIALFISVLALFILYSGDNMIKTSDDLQKCTGLAPMAVVPMIKKKRTGSRM